MDELKIIQPTIKRAPARLRGPLSSTEYNDFQDAVFHDIMSMSESVNTLYNKLQHTIRNIESDNQYLKRRVSSLEETDNYREFVIGKAGGIVDRYIDFHDTSGIIFSSSISDSKRAVFASEFGEIFLPANGVDNRFYNISLRNGQIVVPDDFSVTVTNTFDKVDGNGIKNYEYGGEVSEGIPENAFNGLNESIWVRTVTFPIDSPIEEVECQVTAVVPAGVSAQANLLEVVPFPEGSVDIIQLATASDVSTSFTTLDNFAAINNAVATRYHFSPRDVEQIKIRLRSRNWREIDGKKVFIYGMQELGLKLVDYDKTLSADQSFGQAITAIVKIDAPTGFGFANLYRIDPNPNFFLEDASNRHVRLRLSTTPDFTRVLWDSSANQLPQQLGVGGVISMNGASSIYAIYTLQYIKSSGGYQSPFPVGTTPTAKGLGLAFTVTQNNVV